MKMRITIIAFLFGGVSQLIAQSPVELADEQLAAYNAGDIEAFLIPYSDTVKVYDEFNNLMYQGKETMRKLYSRFFETAKDLECELLNRITVGATVIEHEKVTYSNGQRIIAIVMYKVQSNKIQEVYFLESR